MNCFAKDIRVRGSTQVVASLNPSDQTLQYNKRYTLKKFQNGLD